MARKKKASESAKAPKNDVIEAEIIEAPEDVEIVDEEVSEPDTAHENEEPVVTEAATPRQSGGFFAPILGGVVAVALGFGVAIYAGLGNWPFANSNQELSALQQRVEEQSQTIGGLQAEIAALSAQIQDANQSEQVQFLADRSSGQDSQIANLKTLADRLTSQVRDLKNRPIPDVGATVQAVEAYETELAAMREMLAFELDRIRAAEQSAASLNSEMANRQAQNEVRRAIEELAAAADTGGTLKPTLTRLSALGADVDALASFSGGVLSLTDLQATFPAVARSVLDNAIEEDIAAGRESKASGFLKAQLGIRTLGPKDGDTVDAVLSRAEDSLMRGNLDTALKELSGLTETTRALMSDWMTKAGTRRDALNAIAELSAVIGK